MNSAINFIKKDKANAEKQLLFAASNSLEVVPEDDAANAEEALLNVLEDALKLLPEKCRQVMYLSRFGKLKQQEIADQMEISIKTVKNHLTYGFQKLREHLEQRKKTIVTILMLLNILTP
ncbi:RNA polymerase sigma factor RpoE [compost metagenome]